MPSHTQHTETLRDRRQAQQFVQQVHRLGTDQPFILAVNKLLPALPRMPSHTQHTETLGDRQVQQFVQQVHRLGTDQLFILACEHTAPNPQVPSHMLLVLLLDEVCQV